MARPPTRAISVALLRREGGAVDNNGGKSVRTGANLGDVESAGRLLASGGALAEEGKGDRGEALALALVDRLDRRAVRSPAASLHLDESQYVTFIRRLVGDQIHLARAAAVVDR